LVEEAGWVHELGLGGGPRELYVAVRSAALTWALMLIPCIHAMRQMIQFQLVELGNEASMQGAIIWVLIRRGVPGWSRSSFTTCQPRMCWIPFRLHATARGGR